MAMYVSLPVELGPGSLSHHLCQGRSTPYVGDGHFTFNRNRYNGYINPYYWVDDHPLLYGNNGSLDLDASTFHRFLHPRWEITGFHPSTV